MLKPEIQKLLRVLANDATIRGNLMLIADGTGSQALEKATLLLIEAKCFAFLGHYLPDDALKGVMVDLCLNLGLLDGKERSGE